MADTAYAARIKEHREACGMTQEDLASATGISRVSIARYEVGSVVPSLTNASKIANALNCNVDDLLKEEEQDAGKEDEVRSGG